MLTPKTLSTRPTSVLVRRKIFDWRQRMDEFIFLDVFAGSGSMGFEALSRGAEKIFLNDSNKTAFLTLRDNKLRFEKAFTLPTPIIQLSNMDAKLWVTRELNSNLNSSSNAVLYIDPPYEQHKLYDEMIVVLKDKKFSGEVWLESDKLKGPKLTDLMGAFSSVIKIVEQGDHFVILGKLV